MLRSIILIFDFNGGVTRMRKAQYDRLPGPVKKRQNRDETGTGGTTTKARLKDRSSGGDYSVCPANIPEPAVNRSVRSMQRKTPGPKKPENSRSN